MESDNKKDSLVSPSDRNVALYATLLGNVFSGSRQLHFLYAKTEKICSAAYLVTEALPEQNLLKSELRRAAIHAISSVLSFIVALQLREGVDRARTEALRSLQEAVSLCRLMLALPGASKMNFSILEREYEDVLTSLCAVARTAAGEPFSLEGLLTVEAPHGVSAARSPFASEGSSLASNGFAAGATSLPRRESAAAKERPKASQPLTSSEARRVGRGALSARTDTVLAFLKDKGQVSIKDISRSITDCSEKTIQRLLVQLVELGRVTRIGERRWSTYVLTK